jgi:hypothetical protein
MQLGSDLLPRGRVTVQFEQEGVELLVRQPVADDVEGGGLLADEEDGSA